MDFGREPEESELTPASYPLVVVPGFRFVDFLEGCISKAPRHWVYRWNVVRLWEVT
jgi:hypothetical protein